MKNSESQTKSSRTSRAVSRQAFWSLKIGGGLLAIIFAVFAASCALPNPPSYPYYGPYGNAQGVTNEARRRSAALEQYIKDWLDGRVGAQIPENLLPEGRSAGITTFTLQRPDEVDPNQQWISRPAHTINFNDSYGNFNDPHASYLVNAGVLIPFGSKIIIEGEFPHARYFSVQSVPAFAPELYRNGPYGNGEVAWVDADINPLPGNINPFRVGANRAAANRNYRITCDVAIGDPTVLDQAAWSIPLYRNPGDNNRHCSGLVFRGPWGDPNGTDGDKRGLWSTGEMWIRYYAPDRNVDAFGGVTRPKVLYQLPDGRQYYILPEQSSLETTLNGRRALFNQTPSEPQPAGNAGGWDKQMSILRSIYGGITTGLGYPSSDVDARRRYVRELDKGVAARGEDLPSISNHEPHATGGVHINYLTNSMCLGAGKVFAFAGTLPTTPRTRNGENIMTAAQARYWSITGYSQAYDLGNPNFQYGAEITSLMDDEIATDAQNRYVIMYGRATDRPANATAQNGVTWIDWGPEACQSFTLRWASIGPEWSFAKSPNQGNLSWEASFASASYNPNKIGRNNRNGFLGNYQPVATYLTKAQFEALGDGFNPLTLPPYISPFAGSKTKFDFDGDSRADIIVFRPLNGVWYTLGSQNGFSSKQFGSASDELVPSDYDGDGKTDLAVFRDGNWYILNSAFNTFSAVQFGLPTDTPVPGDYDGDGKADTAVFRDGIWYISNSRDNSFRGEQFGLPTDKPVVGDFDDDGKQDLAVFRPLTGVWYVNRSRDGFFSQQFGLDTDKLVPADYDGDGKTDLAVFRDGSWYILNSSNNQFVALQFGLPTDIPVSADYNGDRRVDPAVYRNGTWYVNLSPNNQFYSVQFGQPEDIPAQASFLQ